MHVAWGDLLISEAAKIIDRSADSVRRYVDQGKIPARRTAGGVRILRREDVETFLRERNRNKAAAE